MVSFADWISMGYPLIHQLNHLYYVVILVYGWLHQAAEEQPK